MVALLRLLHYWRCCLSAALQLAVLFARADRYFKKYGPGDLEGGVSGTAKPRSACVRRTGFGGTRRVRRTGFGGTNAAVCARRHRHYFFGAVFLGAVFGHLRGRALDYEEMQRFSTLAALASFFDDLTDQTAHLQPPSGDISDFGRRADPSGAAHFLLEKTRARRPTHHAAGFEESLHRVFQIETEGLQKQAQHPAEAEIARLTAAKGGHSVLLFRFLLAEPLAEPERRALLAFGHLVQLSDDIFDLWHDHQRGTATMATICAANHALGTLARHFEDQVEQVFQTFHPIPIQGHRRESALHTVRFLVASTRVCLRHYRHLEKKCGKLPLDDRRLMVADMGKWRMRLQVVGAVAIPRFI